MFCKCLWFLKIPTISQTQVHKHPVGLERILGFSVLLLASLIMDQTARLLSAAELLMNHIEYDPAVMHSPGEARPWWKVTSRDNCYIQQALILTVVTVI